MGFLFALLGVLSESAAKTVDRFNFRYTHIAAKQLVLWIFAGMSGSILVYIAIARSPLPHFSFLGVGFLSLIALISFAGNVFDYLSLKVNDLALREPLINFQPVLAGFIGYVLFPSERRPIVLVAFLLATMVITWKSRHHLNKTQEQGMLFLLLAVGAYSILPSIYKLVLGYASPTYITLFRSLAIFILSVLFLKTKMSATTRQARYGLSSGAIYAAGSVFNLYAIHKLGIGQTMLLTLLAPAFMYAASYFVLKEKVRRDEIISSILLLAIAIATFLI